MNATPAIVPRLMLAACLLALVTGCGSQADNAAADAEKKIEARIDAPPPPAPPADATPIQVQPGPRGTQVKLMSAKVTEEMVKAFDDLYLKDAADTMAPVRAIALFDEFKELAPSCRPRPSGRGRRRP